MSLDPLVTSQAIIRFAVSDDEQHGLVVSLVEGGTTAEGTYIPPSCTHLYLTSMELKAMIERLMALHETLIGRRH